MQLGLPIHNSECFLLVSNYAYAAATDVLCIVNSTPLHTAKLTYTIEMPYPRRMSKEHLEAATRAGKNEPLMLVSKGGSKEVANCHLPTSTNWSLFTEGR